MEKKYIHYCWFGNKPLSRLAKKCIASWKKYLPDYEIIEWNEKNFDINICPFVKEAYENKKWAFVSDYARLYALYNYGGLYLDTDVEILKNVNDILEDEIFLGREDEDYFATAVIGVKNKHSKYIKDLLDYYDKLIGFDTSADIFSYANPKIITKEFSKYDKKILQNKIELYDDIIKIYPRDYFYPLNYDYSKKMYTENTCMVHYFNATWTPKGERLAITLYRKFGSKTAKKILNILYFFSRQKHRIIDSFKRRNFNIKMKLSIHFHINKRVNNIKNMLSQLNEPYVAIYHPDWIGVSNSTKDIFNNTIPLREQFTEKEAKMMAQAIVDSGKKVIIFNAFANGWDLIIKEIKKIDTSIKVKIILHGSNALLSEEYDWYVNNLVFTLYKENFVDEICTVKKSLYEFYKLKGINTSFIMNTVNIENKEKYINMKEESNDKIKIGLYMSGDRWVKNVYNQLSAVSLIENAKLDCLPLNYKIVEFCNRFNIAYSGEYSNISRDEMFKRLAKNDVNLYVTFTECAPLLPLESLELGVPCITGDNHHYFEGTELEKYLVVNKEDNIIEIYNKIKLVLENKEKIMKAYKEWKVKYDRNVEANNIKILE